MTATTPLTNVVITKKTNVSVSPVFLDDAMFFSPWKCELAETSVYDAALQGERVRPMYTLVGVWVKDYSPPIMEFAKISHDMPADSEYAEISETTDAALFDKRSLNKLKPLVFLAREPKQTAPT